jgi:DNA-binding beta-propeller fold protein YncE
LNYPLGLAVNKEGFVLVADYSNNRILALDPTLSRASNVTLPLSIADQIVAPRGLWLNESRFRLYIGESNDQLCVLVFENFIVNITDAFFS